MTRKQLQMLISAGVFSAALLSGAAYADDSGKTSGSDTSGQAATQNPPPQAQQQAPSGSDGASQAATDTSNSKDDKHSAKTDKPAGQNGCAGAGGCSAH